MIEAYWQIGKRIVEKEQDGKERADYGSYLIKNLSKELLSEFGKGFSGNYSIKWGKTNYLRRYLTISLCRSEISIIRLFNFL
ncbi:MAG: DUF1016 N-terminal domain-containing protein [Pseudomonadota bacterium]